MKTIKIQQLSRENFNKFGSYAMMIDPMDALATGPKDAPIAFFRDMLQQDTGGTAPSFSTCRIQNRPLIVEDAEYHNYTCEVAMPMDQDAILWFAPATASDDFPVDQVEAFLVPKGCIVMIRPGVWHHAAFATENRPLNTLIVLPERTYVNDCIGVVLSEDKKFAMEF